MDTPNPSRPSLPRWLRVGVFFTLIAMASGTLTYLLTWYAPAAAPVLVPIRITSYSAWSVPRPRQADKEGSPGTTRAAINQTLDDLAQRTQNEPVIVHLSGIALQAETGGLVVVPSDGTPGDSSSWLPLREVLEKLKSCPSKHKLLVFEWTAPPVLDRSGVVHHDIAAALPRELDAVPDVNRLVLSACSAGQQSHHSDELGQSVFAHYFQQALLGSADGHGDARDSRITTAELAAFVQARVERWSLRNRGERQTPALLGTGGEFTVASVDHTAQRESAPVVAERKYSDDLSRSWQERDRYLQMGLFWMAPREFQRQQGIILRDEQHGNAASMAFRTRYPKIGDTRFDKEFETPEKTWSESIKKRLDEQRRILDQQLVDARPAEAERIKKRFIEDMRAKVDDGAVFAHVLADPRLDPGMLRLFDQLLHSASPPKSPESLRLRQLADLAMRVEVQAWPRDLVELLLRCTDAGERAFEQTPHLPGYFALLEEPAFTRHAGEVRLWTRGYADPAEAKRRLSSAHDQFDRLIKLNEQWEKCAHTLDETLAELPWYLEALEALPELRDPWQQTAGSARVLADTLKQTHDDRLPWSVRVERLTGRLAAAEKERQRLQQHRLALHAPFARDAIARLERQCRSPHADAGVRQQAAGLLSVAAPVLKAEERVTLWNAVQAVSKRLNDETLALDRQDDEAQRPTPSTNPKMPPIEDETRRAALRAGWHIALLELAGMTEEQLEPLRQASERAKKDAGRWCEVGGMIRRLAHEQMGEQWQQETAWRERERLAWLMPPLAGQKNVRFSKDSPTRTFLVEQRNRRDRWLGEHRDYLRRDYHGLNFESPGIVAARSFHGTPGSEAHVRLKIARSVEPLTEKQPYAHVLLEVTRHVPPGTFGPVELRFHRADDVWLEFAPDVVTLPPLAESKEPRILTSQVPLKVARLPKAERTGLPAPLGFLVEAKFAGRSYHHLVTVPIVPNTQELQILVSADPDEPANTLDEIRVRPGKTKQPHFVYLRNLTNRKLTVHAEIKAGNLLVCKTPKWVTLEPDGVHKVRFDDGVRTSELRGPLAVRVLDADRQKLLAERTLKVEIMAPHEYVKIAAASYEPGPEARNRWTVEVQASRPLAGPAIAAQLVLPVQRIPGLLGIGGGTLQAELPTQDKSPRILFAERLRLIPTLDEEGPVYLHIDGVPRAFVYRTKFARAGQATQPTPDERPAVRLLAPPCVMAGVNCLIDVEVDNAPRGARLEIALGRFYEDQTFKADMVREFTDAKKHRIDLEQASAALSFAGTIADQTATFDTRSIVGPRHVRARLLDGAGKEIAKADQSLVIDDSPPVARLAPIAAQVKKGSVLPVLAQGVDAESGVAQVVFFYGKPDKGEIPPAAPRFKAVPANRENTHWSASLQVPADHKGPLAVSVQVVNHAGMAFIDTVTLEVTDNEPGKTGMGEIRGKVVEGPRPQPNLLVTLLDERGKEIARTKTQADGTYLFTQIAPGRYRVFCVKPESQRRAILGVTVEPDRLARADLALAL